jgi:hypothetical protein
MEKDREGKDSSLAANTMPFGVVEGAFVSYFSVKRREDKASPLPVQRRDHL